MLTLWTGDASLAAAADAAGVQRIGVDLERHGKSARQSSHATWISPHRIEEFEAVCASLLQADAFARIDGLHAGTRSEVERLLARGADVLMAPMVASAADASEFAGLVAGRARTVALVETRQGIERLPEIAATPGIDEVHIGINDLSLSLNLKTRWAVLTGALLQDAAACVRAAGKPFGFGAIGRAQDDSLPLSSDLVYAEYARVGATRALMARSFGVTADTVADLVAAAQARIDVWRQAPADLLASTHAELVRRVAGLGRW